MQSPNSDHESKSADFIVRVLRYSILIVPLILIILLVKWGYGYFFGPDYSKPWWTGTESQQVCATGDSYGDCGYFQVSSDGVNITTIHHENGGYTSIKESSCHKAASGEYKFDRFCRVVDTDGNKFDVNPRVSSE